MNFMSTVVLCCVCHEMYVTQLAFNRSLKQIAQDSITDLQNYLSINVILFLIHVYMLYDVCTEALVHNQCCSLFIDFFKAKSWMVCNLKDRTQSATFEFQFIHKEVPRGSAVGLSLLPCI